MPHRIRNGTPECIPPAAGLVRSPRSTLRLAESANILFSGPYEVTQLDLQREFHLARHHAVHPHHIPQLSRVSSGLSTTSDVPGIRATVTAARHLLEMYRRQLQDEKARHKAQCLGKRLLRVALELDRLPTAEK